MGATYDKSLGLERDHVRLRLGDTDVKTALLEDETIDAMLGAYPFNEAVAQLAMSLVAKVSQEPDKLDGDGGLAIEWRERIASWKAVAKDMRASSMQREMPARSGVALGQPTLPDTSALR